MKILLWQQRWEREGCSVLSICPARPSCPRSLPLPAEMPAWCPQKTELAKQISSATWISGLDERWASLNRNVYVPRKPSCKSSSRSAHTDKLSLVPRTFQDSFSAQTVHGHWFLQSLKSFLPNNRCLLSASLTLLDPTEESSCSLGHLVLKAKELRRSRERG